MPLCFIIYHICKHPAVKSHLIADIDATLPSNADTLLSYDSLTAPIYHCSDERVLPVSNNSSNSFRKTTWLPGYKWRAGTTFGVNHGIIHRHKAYWKGPEAFKPERFLDECEDKVKPKTFSGALRIFPGRFVVDRLVKTFLIMLFRKYEVELCEPDKEIEYRYAMTNKCKGLKVYLKARNKETVA